MVPALRKEFGYANVMAVPKIERIVVNMGLGEATQNAKVIDTGTDELTRIAGQKPITTRAKKSVANFKIRKGLVVGAMVTLRGRRMEEFLDRLVSYVLPRIRDFRGLATKLDGHGNYAIGLKEHTVFPEIPNTDVQKTFGLQIQITTTAGSDERAKLLLKQVGVPFRPDRRID